MISKKEKSTEDNSGTSGPTSKQNYIVPPPQRIVLIGDYGPRDLAFAEVVLNLDHFFGHICPIDFASTSPFDTVTNGQAISEAIGQVRNALIFHNVAPRTDELAARRKNEGEKLCAAYIKERNVLVVGPRSGESYVPMREMWNIAESEIPFSNDEGTQFRSRRPFVIAAVREWMRVHVEGDEVINPVALRTPSLAWTQSGVPSRKNGKFTRVFWLSDRAHLSGQFKNIYREFNQSGLRTAVVPVGLNAGDAHSLSFLAAQLGQNAMKSRDGQRTTEPLILLDMENAFRGEQLWFGKTEGGAVVIGPDNPACWVHLTDAGVEVFAVNATGRQIVCAAKDIYKSQKSTDEVLGQKPVRIVMAETQLGGIQYIDGYGNVKFIFDSNEIIPDQGRVSIEINRRSFPATVTSGSFSVRDGEIAVSRGSSGWTRNDGTPVVVRELFLRGGSFAATSGVPRLNHGHSTNLNFQLHPVRHAGSSSTGTSSIFVAGPEDVA